jgi:hypothetical protein
MTITADGILWAVDGPPVGIWGTSMGTGDILMRDVLCLRPDGTGYVINMSVLRGNETLPVLWRHEAPGQLELATLLPDDDPEDPDLLWQHIDYCAAIVATDVGNIETLKNIDNDVFGMLVGPIALLSRVPD